MITTLKELFKNGKKEIIYEFYQKILGDKAKDYEKVTRLDIYRELLSLYQEDPEMILRLCTLEEVNVLKRLVGEDEVILNEGYIDYLVINNLRSNFLIHLQDNGKYKIYKDLINYVKMAFNLFNYEEYSLKDVLDSAIIGIVRVYNVLSLSEFIELLTSYNSDFTSISFKTYVTNNPRLRDKLKIVKYKGKNYVVSLENFFYKDIIKMRNEEKEMVHYDLESLISVGKYKINLFDENIFKFLNFLELHLAPVYIEEIINEIIIYSGLQLNDNEVLKVIANDIEPLYKALSEIVLYMPSWLP